MYTEVNSCFSDISTKIMIFNLFIPLIDNNFRAQMHAWTITIFARKCAEVNSTCYPMFQ